MRLRALIRPATLKWTLWVIAGVSFVLAALSFVPPNPSPFWGVLFFFIGQIMLMLVDEFVKRHVRSVWVEEWFGSYENFRASLDIEELRRMKEERGQANAVLWLRRDFPFLPLTRIRELVDDL